MSLHESIVSDLHAAVAANDADIITATSLALVIQRKYAPAGLEPHIEYASLEGLKHLARNVLSGRYSAESDQTEAHQGELFSGRLQTRYPLPRSKGEEPGYKLREALTKPEAAWNIATLRKAAEARLLHADALEAWDQSRPDPEQRAA
jgi:hypothetical protein